MVALVRGGNYYNENTHERVKENKQLHESMKELLKLMGRWINDQSNETTTYIHGIRDTFQTIDSHSLNIQNENVDMQLYVIIANMKACYWMV